MSDWPKSGLWIPPPVVGCDSFHAVGIGRRQVSASGAQASAAWPAADRAIFVPVWLPDEYHVKSLFVVNGTAVSGTIDLGIYTDDGAQVVHTGSTTQAGTSTLQIITVTDTPLGPGAYYMAMSMSNTTGTTFSNAPTVIQLQQLGVLQAATQTPLAASPTLATVVSAYLPLIGFSNLTTY